MNYNDLSTYNKRIVSQVINYKRQQAELAEKIRKLQPSAFAIVEQAGGKVNKGKDTLSITDGGTRVKVNTAKLREELPDIYNKYTTEYKTASSLRYTSKR